MTAQQVLNVAWLLGLLTMTLSLWWATIPDNAGAR